LKQSTINQKTKWYYIPLDINLIKIHPFYKHFNTNYPIFNREAWENWLILHSGYSETRCKLVILNFWTLQTAVHAVPFSVSVMLHGL
jgi:hypothetical protein